MWVLVADSGIGRIFRVATPLGELQEIECLTHSASRAKGRDLGTDRAGRTFDSFGGARHAKEVKTEPKEVEAIQFAEQLAERLKAARVSGDTHQLAIVAAPHFLGLLRRNLDTQTRALVTLEVDQDLVRLGPAEIRKHLPERLFSSLQSTGA